MKPRIALEGGINKCSDGECIDWRRRVIEALSDRYDFHNPMDLDCRGREAEMEDELVRFDTVGLASSDFVLAMAEKPSWGTAMGIQMAWAMHKPVVSVCSSPAPSPWLKNRSVAIFGTLDEAIRLFASCGIDPTPIDGGS